MPNRKLENAVKEKIVTQQVVNLRFKELLSRFDQDLKRKGL